MHVMRHPHNLLSFDTDTFYVLLYDNSSEYFEILNQKIETIMVLNHKVRYSVLVAFS